MYPSTEIYTQIVNSLLERHYGITLDDTAFDADAMARSLQNDIKAWELVNAIAEDADIERVDTGWLPLPRITSEDEVAFMLLTDLGKEIANISATTSISRPRF